MIDAAAIALWGKFALPVDGELALLNRVIAGVSEHIMEFYVVANPMTNAQEQAVLMQTSRLWRRRQSLDGVAAFNNDIAIRVSRLDPDVQELLHLKFDFA